MGTFPILRSQNCPSTLKSQSVHSLAIFSEVVPKAIPKQETVVFIQQLRGTGAFHHHFISSMIPIYAPWSFWQVLPPDKVDQETSSSRF
jgi:hypothetical protein